MTFKDFYLVEKGKPTPSQVFIERIAKLTKRSKNTVKMWANGLQAPDALAQDTIAKELGVEASELFPKNA